ncbi:DUF302 domain-containing protein [Paenibacillus validus]|uniref:DUF302 domain-containing protein n=1 Tax=Paenibacillus TaxID=44249 RepID=UPI000FDA89EA|nr:MULTISPECIES: DUF302 domain-containing protein [Paenibacillus]MED4599722.1 DUF302 domain-containing protein [Paenibacillus validus]MED4604845.1 DUF302 domain-containing protein [Paenibacillus validus]NTZ19088.1 DUF302 domain-containing protein [Paenibacillus sp. JMULE4]
MFHYTVKTAKTPKEAISALTENLKEEKFGVLWQLDMQEKLHEKGVDFDNTYHILEVCNPNEAKRVLSENALVGYFLPCKLAVYEESGSTRIGLPKPTALIGLVENDELMAIASDIEKRLIACVEKKPLIRDIQRTL